MNLLRFSRRHAPSALLFLTGIGAMYLVDIIISRNASTQDIAAWATLKSFVLIAATISLFGVDQLVVREPKATALLLRVALFNVPVIGTVLAIIATSYGLIPTLMSGLFPIIALAICNLSFQWLRSRLRTTEAYIVYASWRFFLLLGVIIFSSSGVASINSVLIISFTAAIVLIAVIIKRKSTSILLVSIHNDSVNVKDVYLLGSYYFISSISLAIASYGEAIVISNLGTFDEVAQYFQAAVIFLFPGVIANQFLAAQLAPLLRQDENRITKLIKRYISFVVLVPLILLPVLIVGGYTLEWMLHGTRQTPLALAVILSLTSCVRMIYVVPSSFVGVLANRHKLRSTSAAYLACASLLPILGYILVSGGISVVIAVALANLINWALRCLVGVSFVMDRLKSVEVVN